MSAESPREVTVDQALAFLESGTLEVVGLLPYASNATLLAKVALDGLQGFAVYKPRRGERPLWDFPSGTLCLRERAAWLVDRALGWDLIPPTILRDGPAGFGAVQLWIDVERDVDLDDIVDTHMDDIRRVALFDVITNNADRKGSHCIVDERRKLWAIDHGICFNVDDKLRTVIWIFADEPVPDELLGDLDALRSRLCAPAELHAELEELLDPDELVWFVRRIEGMLRARRFPAPGSRRHVPWPPW